MVEIHGSNFVAFDNGIGNCVCGKEHIRVTAIKFTNPVKIRTYNNKEAEGLVFNFGSECIETFKVDNINPIIQEKDVAFQRRRSKFMYR